MFLYKFHTYTHSQSTRFVHLSLSFTSILFHRSHFLSRSPSRCLSSSRSVFSIIWRRPVARATSSDRSEELPRSFPAQPLEVIVIFCGGQLSNKGPVVHVLHILYFLEPIISINIRISSTGAGTMCTRELIIYGRE